MSDTRRRRADCGMRGKTSDFTDAEKIALQAFDAFAFEVAGYCVMGGIGETGPFALLLFGDGADKVACVRCSTERIQEIITSLQEFQQVLKGYTQ